jgi:hypothetical protein
MSRRIAGQRRGRGGRHLPARVRRAGHRRAVYSQQQRGDARRFGRQRQPAAGGQVEQGRATAQFHHQPAQRRTAQRIDRRTQQHGVITHHPQQQARRIKAKRSEAGAIGKAADSRGAVAAQPQQGRVPTRQLCPKQRKAGRRPLFPARTE